MLSNLATPPAETNDLINFATSDRDTSGNDLDLDRSVKSEGDMDISWLRDVDRDTRFTSMYGDLMKSSDFEVHKIEIIATDFQMLRTKDDNVC